MHMATDITSSPLAVRQRSPAKASVVEELSERSLLLPSLLGRALAANDEAKYLHSLLQAARAHGEDPSWPWSSLRQERLLAARPGSRFSRGGSRKAAPGLYFVPDGARVHSLLVKAIEDMIVPLEVGRPHSDDNFRTYANRLERLVSIVPELTDDRIPGSYVDEITSACRDRGDSLHMLVMDPHQSLTRLQAELATESVDGAAVNGLGAGERQLVGAFMSGLNETSPLRFDHPGVKQVANGTDNSHGSAATPSAHGDS